MKNTATQAALKTAGDDIRTARLRRGWSQAELARRAGITEKTLRKVERDPATVSLGIYADVLGVLGMVERLAMVADPSADELGLALERRDRPQRVRRRVPDNNF